MPRASESLSGAVDRTTHVENSSRNVGDHVPAGRNANSHTIAVTPADIATVTPANTITPTNSETFAGTVCVRAECSMSTHRESSCTRYSAASGLVRPSKW